MYRMKERKRELNKMAAMKHDTSANVLFVLLNLSKQRNAVLVFVARIICVLTPYCVKRYILSY